MAGAHAKRRLPGFTLVELLIVVAIIALLISILLPSLAAARAQARTMKCQSNARQIALGWITYASEHNSTLPGGMNDFIDMVTGTQPPNNPPQPVDYGRYRPLDWLGTIGNSGQQSDHVPSKGTIFPYVGRVEELYKCPQDIIDVIDGGPFGNFANETKYSYTAPPLLTGARMEMLRATRFADGFPANHSWQWWKSFTTQSLPWLLVEEDEEEALAYVADSAWSNVDRVSDRHPGRRGMMAYLDGHAGARKFQRMPKALDSWRVYYELTDGRIAWARHIIDTQGKPMRFGYLRSRYVWVLPDY
ncbi:MAG TPA: DUF1559 domain-containing protein [Phycisphaerae bacterium]|nr:DUF1559 domain-containing protein [Phycisphaerae bacterium]